MALGLVSIALMYRFSRDLFDDRLAGLLSATLLAVNPAHVWLSATPLTELPYSVCVLAAMLGFIRHLKRKRPLHLYGAAIAVMVATGLRFEGWVIAGLFAVSTVLVAGSHLKWRDKAGEALLRSAGPIAIAGAFPLIWLTSSYVATGDLLAWLTAIRAYKATWYGNHIDFNRYWQVLLRLDPVLTVLGPAGVAGCLTWFRDPRVRWYAAMATIPVAVFLILHHGQVEPPGNYVRYLATFMFAAYPALACLIVQSARRLRLGETLRPAVIAIAVVAMAAMQARTALAFVNDPASAGLKVGQRIRELWKQSPAPRTGPILVELWYWQYLAVEVGANSLSGIVFDRPVDYDRRSSTSVLLEDPDGVRNCLARLAIPYVIVKSPDLRQAAALAIGALAVEEVGEYTFLEAPSSALSLTDGADTCTCEISPGDYFGITGCEWHGPGRQSP